MNGTTQRFLLDTNAAIAIIDGDPALDGFLAGEIYVPVVVIGELYYGAENSGRVQANVKRVDEFVSQRVVLNCDHETARHYGRIRHQLRAKGRKIPHNDTWIAAIALQHSLTVLTLDAHFNAVDGLAVQGW